MEWIKKAEDKLYENPQKKAIEKLIIDVKTLNDKMNSNIKNMIESTFASKELMSFRDEINKTVKKIEKLESKEN